MKRRRHTRVAYPQAVGALGTARVVLVPSGPTSTGRCLVHALLRSYGMGRLPPLGSELRSAAGDGV